MADDTFRGRRYELEPPSDEPVPVVVALMDLVLRLLEQHRVRSRRDPFSSFEQYFVQCPACGGNEWQIWQPGEPVVECRYIRDARALGIEV